MAGSSLQGQTRVPVFQEAERTDPPPFPFPEAIPVTYAPHNAVQAHSGEIWGDSGAELLRSAAQK